MSDQHPNAWVISHKGSEEPATFTDTQKCASSTGRDKVWIEESKNNQDGGDAKGATGGDDYGDETGEDDYGDETGPTIEEQVNKVFEEFDKDGDGSISVKDLKKSIRKEYKAETKPFIT